jgi:type I restriction enzyme, R subunit
MAKNFISEDDIEKALLAYLYHEFRIEHLNCYTPNPDNLEDGSNRADKRDVVFAERLQKACKAFNPDIPSSVIEEQVIPKIMDRRGAMNALAANMELYDYIRDGVQVTFDDEDGRKQYELVKLINFDEHEENEFLAVSQLWIKTTVQAPKAAYRRPDVILYVNGLPLVFIELKNSNVKLKSAYEDNLRNYKHDIPQLFHCNAACILSNAIETKVGSFTAGWEHFFNWFRKESEEEEFSRAEIKSRRTSLEYVLGGLCNPKRLLDYYENFILFHKDTAKIIAQNHQFIGVNNAFKRFLQRHELKGKLGVFWHTQGSGKSFSMIFYTRKIFRKVIGNFSFVVVTDRKDLDQQIYRNFLNTGTVKQNEAAQPGDAEEMRKFLGQNKRILFTLIQKFRWEKGGIYPRLFDPDKEDREIIVMVDEAHRTQYETFAENMRSGLQGAHYLAFTGTPLLGKKRKTNAWFGDYVSEYNFQQAMEDGATVPLYYEKRVPEVLIQNEDLSEEFYELLEDENLSEVQKLKLEKKFAQQVEVIKRDDRLDTVAQDIVHHFPRRGYLGKGMVITLDKFTAVKMYEKVSLHWKKEIKRLRGLINSTKNEIEKRRFKKIVDYMKSVEMAVVISDPRADQEKFEKAELNIEPHIKRLESIDPNGHDTEFNYKDPEHPLQLVFVCAMWLTGFDNPTISTLYLDKPMRNHTLMQAIARANRVCGFKIKGYTGGFVEKKNGEIVDYYNVFRSMKRALKDYGQGQGGKPTEPVTDKANLFCLLDEAIEETVRFCLGHEIDLFSVAESGNIFKNISEFESFADILLSQDELRKSFFVYQNTVSSLYEAAKPEVLSLAPRRLVPVIEYLRGVIDVHLDQIEFEDVIQKVSELLDESLVVDDSEGFRQQEHQAEYKIVQKGKTWDLSKIDFDKLRSDFKETNHKNIEITELRTFIENKLQSMMQENHNRIDFAQRLQGIVDEYNAGGTTNECYFDELVKFTQKMQEEEERHIREGLSKDELELYDTILKKSLSKEDEKKVKLAAKNLLVRLIEEHPKVLVQDWWKDGQSLAKVKSAVEEVLDESLPDTYGKVDFKEKSSQVFDLIVNFAANGLKWAA